MPMFLIFEWNIKTPDRYPIISVRSILDAFCSPLLTMLTGWCVLLLLAIQCVLIYRLGTHFLTDQHTVETCVSLDSWPVYIITSVITFRPKMLYVMHVIFQIIPWQCVNLGFNVGIMPIMSFTFLFPCHCTDYWSTKYIARFFLAQI